MTKHHFFCGARSKIFYASHLHRVNIALIPLELVSFSFAMSSKPKARGRRAVKEERSEQILDNQSTVGSTPSDTSTPFFGLVDSNELDYFKQAELTLNINAFDSAEERDGFIHSVLEEARGKELKLVTNQICSKLMERLVLFALNGQLKRMFRGMRGHFVPLSHHKYSSHVLETLLVRSAALIEKELAEPITAVSDDAQEDFESSKTEVSESMETLFIAMLDEYKPLLLAMAKHQYASHVLRLILLIAAGKELPSTTVSNSTLRSKKSKIARKMIEIVDNEDFNRAFATPPSFKNELKQLCTALTSGLDTQSARTLAVDKVASPVIQLVILLEGIIDRERSMWHLVFLKDTEGKSPQEEAFVEHLLSDGVGSHFLEAIVRNDGARIKYIERLYDLYMKHRVLKLCRRATTGVYVVQALMLKLKPKQVEHILDEVVPQLSELLSISSTENFDLAQKLIDASIKRDNYRRDEIIAQLFQKYAPSYPIDSPYRYESAEMLENILHISESTLGNTRDDWPTAEERKRSLFLEKLMEYDYKFIPAVWLNFMALPKDKFEQFCLHGVFSHVVESALSVIPATEGEPKPVQILRKRFLNLFSGIEVNLACNSYGSHIMDGLWGFTVLLPMYKDRIATALVANATQVKESRYGKMVWKNWGMELFSRKKFDWKQLIKQQEAEYFEERGDGAESSRPKRPIELKLERLAEEAKLKEENALKAESGYTKRKLDAEFAELEKRRTRGRR